MFSPLDKSLKLRNFISYRKVDGGDNTSARIHLDLEEINKNHNQSLLLCPWTETSEDISFDISTEEARFYLSVLSDLAYPTLPPSNVFLSTLQRENFH